MDPDAVARAAAAAALTGRRSVTPGWPNRLFLFAARLLPVSLQTRLVRVINRRRGVDHEDR